MNRLLTTTALLLAAVGTLAACAKHESRPEEIRPVRAERVASGKFDLQAGYAGEVRARYETRLGFRVAGKIISRSVEVGSEVKAGDVLAQIDPRDLQLNEDSLKAQVISAQSELELAKAELARYTDLYNKNFISKAELDRRQNTFKTASAKLEQAQSQLRQGANQSSYAVLRADHAGVITAIDAEVGQVVGTGQTVMRLARPEQKEVIISVPENRVEELRKAQEISVTLWARPDVQFAGEVREIAPNTDSVTRTYTAKISVPSATEIMRLGMTANVYLRRKLDKATMQLPLSAIYQKNNQPSVWVVDENAMAVSLVPVQLGDYVQNRAIVLSGLKDGQLVITAGVHLLNPGQKVRVLDSAR